MINDILFNMLGISATVGVIGAALALFGHRCRMSAKWLCICWAILAVRLLVPFNLPISLWSVELPAVQAVYENTSAPAAQNIFYENITASSPTSGSTVVGSASAENSALSADDIIAAAVWVWLTGAVVFILWQGLIYMYERRNLLRWSRCADSSTIKAAEIIAEELQIKQRYEILISEKAVSPMLMGALRPIIFIPVGFDEARLDLALRHELTHLGRRDIWLKLFLTAANAAHWFNPMVWYIAGQVEKDIESACDERVLAHADRARRRAYCEAILDMMNNRRVPLSTAFVNRKEDIMKRFERILNTKTKKGGIIAAAAVLCCSLLLSGLIGCTEAKTVDTAPKTTIGEEQAEALTAQQEEEAPRTVLAIVNEPTSSEGYMNADAAMDLINQYRTEKGLPELTVAAPSDGSGLYEAASVRLEEVKQTFSHTRTNGEDFSTAFVLATGTDFIEILGSGQLAAEELVDTIKNDEYFEAQLLGNITHGCVVVGQDDEGQTYWIFAACKAE